MTSLKIPPCNKNWDFQAVNTLRPGLTHFAQFPPSSFNAMPWPARAQRKLTEITVPIERYNKGASS